MQVDNLGLRDLARVARRPYEQGLGHFRGMGAILQNRTTIRSIAAGAGGDTLFLTFQFRDGDSPDCSRFNQALRSYLERKGYAYVDQDRFIPDHDPTLQLDDCHFTPKGMTCWRRISFRRSSTTACSTRPRVAERRRESLGNPINDVAHTAGVSRCCRRAVLKNSPRANVPVAHLV